MKAIFSFIIFFITSKSFSQSTEEINVLQLSKRVFEWEVAAEIDSIEDVFDNRFIVVNGTGDVQTKKQYIALLKSGNFVHNKIDVQQDSSVVENNSAYVIGKGKFTVTSSGNQFTVSLSYIEVFTRPQSTMPWKVLAMHATVLKQ